MRSNVTGVQPLYALAAELLAAGMPLDIVDLEIGEKPEARTDKTAVHTLIQAYGNGDLVIPLGGASGIVALEVDLAQGGVESFTKLWKNCPAGKTPVIGTPDGKAYVLMSFEGTPTSTRVDLGPGLALAANGEFIVVPPKESTDRTQGWWNNFPSTATEIAPVPDKLAALL
jgi:hypothetical protein